jgi:hypothetical protein
MATVVYLGNHQAVEVREDGTRIAVDGKRCTRVELPDGMPLPEAVTSLTAAGGVWASHSDAPAPAWVASTDPNLGAALGAWWGCEIRNPDPEG